MIKAIAQLAKVMCIETIAEYVETDNLRVRMADLGVDYGQGFAMGRALPLEELLDELAIYEATVSAWDTAEQAPAARFCRRVEIPPRHPLSACVLHEVGPILYSQRARSPLQSVLIPLSREETMLILTRRAGETLRIGDDIEVTVMAVQRQPGAHRHQGAAGRCGGP